MKTDNEIFDALDSNSRFYDCYGCEFTDEDVAYVRRLLSSGMDFDTAIANVLNEIDDCLGY